MKATINKYINRNRKGSGKEKLILIIFFQSRYPHPHTAVLKWIASIT